MRLFLHLGKDVRLFNLWYKEIEELEIAWRGF